MGWSLTVCIVGGINSSLSLRKNTLTPYGFYWTGEKKNELFFFTFLFFWYPSLFTFNTDSCPRYHLGLCWWFIVISLRRTLHSVSRKSQGFLVTGSVLTPICRMQDSQWFSHFSIPTDLLSLLFCSPFSACSLFFWPHPGLRQVKPQAWGLGP